MRANRTVIKFVNNIKDTNQPKLYGSPIKVCRSCLNKQFK